MMKEKRGRVSARGSLERFGAGRARASRRRAELRRSWTPRGSFRSAGEGRGGGASRRGRGEGRGLRFRRSAASIVRCARTELVEKPTCFTRKYTAVPMASMTYNMKLGDFHTILFRGASHPVSSNRSFPELSCLLMVLGLFDSGSALAIATAENSAEGAREGDAACGSRHGARRRSSRRATRASRR